ncbi:hypothetical protein, partial [Rhodoplanes sp. SY1]|uniref:hypothetical protein n=1 Tax=Rhodoplanes sp. SY1 TaxID=3166646 RepID=UPI0038B4374D
MAFRGRHSLALHAPAYANARRPAGRVAAALTTAQRSALILLLGGPLVSRPRGWCRRGSTLPVASASVVDILVARDLAATATAGETVARLTAHGVLVASTLAAKHADALRLAAEIGRTWLMQRAAGVAAQ